MAKAKTKQEKILILDWSEAEQLDADPEMDFEGEILAAYLADFPNDELGLVKKVA